MTDMASFKPLSTEKLVPLLENRDQIFLLDVREPDEWEDWRIAGAVNIPLGQLEGRLEEVDTDRRIVVICARGVRATNGAEILKTNGISSEVMDGGMGAWASTYDAVSEVFGEATVVQVRRRGKGCLSYLVGSGSRCVVIDPSMDIGRYRNLAQQHGWEITDIVDTHLHADHISGSRELARATGATLRLNPDDPFNYPYEPLTDGLAIELASGVELKVAAVSAPGHTQGSTVYKLGEHAIFTGDTLFLESVGRPDLADQAQAFAENLYQSLHEKILPLADSFTVFPAHFGAVVEVHEGELVAKTLGELRTTLAPLSYSHDEFVQWAIKSAKDRPPNYQHIVRINAGLEANSDEAMQSELGPNRCAIAS
jgi:glyoxylase-like metal-dependent hydrolase (beta-lactamase superfamily II)